jgi:hypothetical protein
MTELVLTNRAVLEKDNFPSVLLKKSDISINPESLVVVASIQSSVNIDVEEIYQSVKMEVEDDSEARELTALKLGRIFTNLMFDIRRRKNMLSLQKNGVLKRIEDVKTKLVKIYSFEKAYSYIGQEGLDVFVDFVKRYSVEGDVLVKFEFNEDIPFEVAEKFKGYKTIIATSGFSEDTYYSIFENNESLRSSLNEKNITEYGIVERFVAGELLVQK